MKPQDMKLKTATTLVLEKCEFDSDESTKLKLLGSKPVEEDLVKYEKFTINDDNRMDPEATFANIIGFESKFYYQLMIFKQDKVQHSEVGIGCVVELNGSTYINRFLSLVATDHEGKMVSNAGVVSTFLEDEYTHMHVTVYPVQKALQLIVDPNTIAVSNSNGPTPIYMENETVLGMMDGDVKSIAMDKIFSLKSFSKSVIDAIIRSTKKLSIKSSSLFCKRLESNSVLLHSTSGQPEEEGSIVYDKKSKCLKLFDGTKWRSLSYEDTKEHD